MEGAGEMANALKKAAKFIRWLKFETNSKNQEKIRKRLKKEDTEYEERQRQAAEVLKERKRQILKLRRQKGKEK